MPDYKSQKELHTAVCKNETISRRADVSRSSAGRQALGAPRGTPQQWLADSGMCRRVERESSGNSLVEGLSFRGVTVDVGNITRPESRPGIAVIPSR